MKKLTVGNTEPVAYVTKGKHRLKQYNNDTVYLKNGDEFELELFNPTKDKVMAKVKLNGNSLGAGIVLRPGERVFIERYLEEARKFMFQTYEVNGKNEEVKRAIENNGDVKVMFYKETINFDYPNWTTWVSSWPTWGERTFTQPPMYDYPNTVYYNNVYGADNNTLNDMSGSISFSSDSPTSYACMDFMPTSMNSKQSSHSRKMGRSTKSVETGRIDKGDISEQKFDHDYSSFNTYWTWESSWKILPLSRKPVVSSDIKVFCTNCGARQKKSSHMFCPNCGTKF